MRNGAHFGVREYRNMRYNKVRAYPSYLISEIFGSRARRRVFE